MHIFQSQFCLIIQSTDAEPADAAACDKSADQTDKVHCLALHSK